MEVVQLGGSQAADAETDWSAIIADLVASGICGGDWERVLDTMTPSRIAALQKRWLECPPLDRIAAAYVGYKKPEAAQHMTPEAAADFMARTGGIIPGVGQR